MGHGEDAGKINARDALPSQVPPPPFDFKPFSGSLLEIPDAPVPGMHVSEFFLPQPSQAEAPPTVSAQAAREDAPAASAVAPLEDLPVKDSVVALAPEEPRFADLSKKRDEQEEEPPRFADLSKGSDSPDEEKPHFHHPTPIRFFDPAADVETSGAKDENAAPTAEVGPRSSNELPPELKAAISHLDEEFRRQHAEKEKPVKAIKSRLRKLKTPKRSEKPVFENPTPAQESAEATAVPESLVAEPQPSDLVAEMQASETVRPEPPVFDEPEPVPVSAFPAQTPESIPISPELATNTLEESEAAEGPPAELAEVLSSPKEIAEFLEETLEEIVETRAIREPVSEIEMSTSHVAEKPSEVPAPERPRNQKPEPSLSERIWRWFEGGGALDGRRRASRSAMPGLVAFYWSGGAPRPHEIVNISRTGFYLRTKELWSPGTLVRMTLQRRQSFDDGEKESIGILARVVRIDEEGVGHEFVTSGTLHSLRARDVLPEHGTNEKELERFLRIE